MAPTHTLISEKEKVCSLLDNFGYGFENSLPIASSHCVLHIHRTKLAFPSGKSCKFGGGGTYLCGERGNQNRLSGPEATATHNPLDKQFIARGLEIIRVLAENGLIAKSRPN
jgi:hypothetical protein